MNSGLKLLAMTSRNRVQNGGYKHYEMGDYEMPYSNYRMGDTEHIRHYDTATRRDDTHTTEKRDYKPMRKIGFDVDAEYETEVDYPEWDEMEHKSSDTKMGHASAKGGKVTHEVAEEWLKSLKNDDGTTGAHWSFEQAKQVMSQKGISADPVEFWVALNMMYSDYCKVAKKIAANNIDFYVEMAKAFLDDKDAAKNKLGMYYEYIVKK